MKKLKTLCLYKPFQLLLWSDQGYKVDDKVKGNAISVQAFTFFDRPKEEFESLAWNSWHICFQKYFKYIKDDLNMWIRNNFKATYIAKH